ncbi:MAG: tetratricopeptide repeat protein, partial [Gemmatimonadota bacterium]
LQRRFEAADVLLAALDDAEAEVRYQAFVALGLLDSKLSEAQREALSARAAALVVDPHPGVQLEARMRVESGVQELLQEASQALLGAQLAEAESLFQAALTRAPGSKRAQYRLARFLYDNGQSQRGLDLLRRHGMLLDVPRLPSSPLVDGRIEGDTAWEAAARTDSFYLYSHRHAVALPATQPTRLYAGYTPEALYLAVWSHDDHPDSLVAKVVPGQEGNQVGIPLDQSIWQDDVVELFLDADFDHRAYAHVGINSAGAASPEWIAGPRSPATSLESWADNQWRPRSRLGTHVGADYWSLECALEYEPGRLPRPRPGDVWGFNAVRTFRGQEYNQWTRTYSGGHSPDDFGVLLFH